MTGLAGLLGLRPPAAKPLPEREPYVLVPGESVIDAAVSLEPVMCSKRYDPERAAWEAEFERTYLLRTGRNLAISRMNARGECPHIARYLIEGVPVCGLHRNQIQQLKRSPVGTAFPWWFIDTRARAPHVTAGLVQLTEVLDRTNFMRPAEAAS